MAESLPFIDTNIFLRHLLQDHADHSPRSTALLHRVAAGLEPACTTVTVVFETVFTAERTYKLQRQ